MQNNVIVEVAKKDFTCSIWSVLIALMTLTIAMSFESYKVGAIDYLSFAEETTLLIDVVEDKDIKVDNNSEEVQAIVTRSVEAIEVQEESIEESIVVTPHFNHQNVLELSHVTVDDLYTVLEGTELYDLAPIYVEAENLYGVNALFIVALTALESGWGTSDRAINDNNLTGFGVYTDDSVGINATSKRENILMTTSWLKEAYLTEGVEHHNGFSIYSINIKYCLTEDGEVDTHWSESITSIGYDLLSQLQK